MYPASAEFKAALRDNHVVVSKAEIWSGDQKLLDLDIASGSVTASSNSAIRRVCSVELFASRDIDNVVPDSAFDFLSPFGNELRLYRGIKFVNGTIEYVPLGIFVMTEISIDDTNEGVRISIQGEDRSILVSRNKWLAPYQMVNSPLHTSIQALLQNRNPDVICSFPTTNVTISQVVLGTDRQNDPWKDAVYLCQIVGFDLYFDVNGIATMTQFPTLDSGAIVASYVENENTTTTNLNRTISTKETYNGVVYTVEGSNIGTPLRIEVWDEDTTSPTYRYGPFGSVPIFYETSAIATQTEAIQAATALLNRYIGAQESVSFSSIVDPTLDVNDVIYVKSVGAKVDRISIVDTVEIPLSPDSEQSVQTRIVRVVGDNEIIGIGE